MISVVASAPATGLPSRSSVNVTWSETKRTTMVARLPTRLASSIGGREDRLDLARLGLTRLLTGGDSLVEAGPHVFAQQRAERGPVAGRKSADDETERRLGTREETRRVEAAIHGVDAGQLAAERARGIRQGTGWRGLRLALDHRTGGARWRRPVQGCGGGAALEAGAPAEHAAQAQHEEHGDHREQHEIEGEAVCGHAGHA